MASYSYWQSRTIPQLSSITDGVTDADKAYMESYAYDEIASLFSELGSNPSGSLSNLTSRLLVSLESDGDLVPASVVTALSGQNLSISNITITGTTTINTVTYNWTAADGGPGDVLTTDGFGNISWTVLPTGTSVWTSSGNNIYFPSGGVGIAGNVGIGTGSAPTYRLTVKQTGDAFAVFNNSNALFFEIDTASNEINSPLSSVTNTWYSLNITTNLNVGAGNLIAYGSSGNFLSKGNMAIGNWGATPTSTISIWHRHTWGAQGTVYGVLRNINASGNILEVNGSWTTFATSAAVAITTLYNYRVSEGSKTPGTTMTTQYGFHIGVLDDATFNWGLWSDTQSVINASLFADNIYPHDGDGTGTLGSLAQRWQYGRFSGQVMAGRTSGLGDPNSAYKFDAYNGSAAAVYAHFGNGITGGGLNNGMVVGINGVGAAFVWNYYSTNMALGTANGTVLTLEAGTQFLGIGASSTNPAWRIDAYTVSDGEGFRIKSPSANSSVWLITENDAAQWKAGVFGVVSDTWILQEAIGGVAFFAVSTGGIVSGTHGTYHTSSDQRLKKNISDIPDALEKVCQMRGVHYEWKEPPYKRNGLQTGMIAQELAQVAPELTQIANDSIATMSIKDDISIDGYLVEAIKALKKQNDDLKAEIEALKAA